MNEKSEQNECLWQPKKVKGETLSYTFHTPLPLFLQFQLCFSNQWCVDTDTGH